MQKIIERISQELAARPEQVAAAVRLLDEGATVPFIARYRKEVTGGLDDTQLRLLEERLGYLRELEERREPDPAQHRGTGQAERRTRRPRSWPPRPRPGWRTSICPTSPSAAPRRRSPVKPGWNRWPQGLLEDPRQDPETRAAGFVDAAKGRPRYRGGPGRGATDPHGALRRGRRTHGPAADGLWEQGRTARLT